MIIENIKQWSGDDINLLSLMNTMEQRDKIIQFYNSKNSWASAVNSSLNDRFQQIGEFIGENNDTMIDLGGHIGLFSLMFNKLFKKILVLEPHPQHFDLLTILTAKTTNIIPFQLAIGTENKIFPLFIDSVNATQTSLFIHQYSKTCVDVQCITLQSLFDNNNIKDIDFLKVDVEGFELPLIMDKSFDEISKNIRKMYIETHNIEDGRVNFTGKQISDAICKKLNTLNFSTRVDNDMIFAQKN